jgi:transcription elongation factor GreA
MPKETLLTQEGYDKLKSEIEDLQTRGRSEVAERIRVAREFGDISENAEYDSAKNEQAMLETRIAHLEEKLRNASVVEAGSIESDVVSVGTTVHLKDQKTSKSEKYKIVGSTEADPTNGKLSNESPIGSALLGRKRNEIVKVPVPRGPARQLKITKIEA